MSARKKIQGFTLMELLIVIAIIGILTSIILVSLNGARTDAKTTASVSTLQGINKALQAYYAKYSTYPVSNGWQGYCSAYGGNLGDNWIPELISSKVVTGSGLPTSPRQPGNGAACVDNTRQIIYWSNGTDYKLIEHNADGTGGVTYQSAPTGMIDPARPTWAFGFWSNGCATGC